MNKLVVDCALEEISKSQGHSPVFNILEAAATASNCAAAALVRSQEGFDQIEASYGVLNPFLRMKIPNTAGERELLSDYIVVKGASKHPTLPIAKLIQEPLGVQFLASAPIELGARDIQMQLIVADDRENARRLPNLKQTLESFSDLTAAVIIESGGLVYRSKAQTENQEHLRQFSSFLAAAPTRIIITDDKFVVLEKSPGFAKFAKAKKIADFSNLSEFFLDDWSRVVRMLEGMKSQNKSIEAISVDLNGEKDSLLCIALLIPDNEQGEATFSIDIRHPFEAMDPDQSITNYSVNGTASENDGARHLEDDPIPVSNFLLETLVQSNRMHSHGGIAYHSLRRWRTPIRAWQIAAFRNLKRNPSETFIDTAALELADAALSLMGAGAFDYVVPVACGHSGPGCFAEKLSKRVAIKLNIEHRVAFHPLEVSGSSHPKRNISRPKMKLVENCNGRILLIDDVATSGSHLVEATKLLRGQTATVLPISWISA